MTAPEFFGALVRAMGLYWLTYGITYLPACFAPVAGYSPALYIFISLGDMIVGVFLMFKADGVVESCYSYAALKGPRSPESEPTTESQIQPRSDPDSLQVLVTVPTEIEASLIVNHLSASGIKASALGASLGALWPELPREVQVVVRQPDLSRAKELLDSFEPPEQD